MVIASRHEYYKVQLNIMHFRVRSQQACAWIIKFDEEKKSCFWSVSKRVMKYVICEFMCGKIDLGIGDWLGNSGE